MSQQIHTLIVGEQGVGKSTLLHRVLDTLQLSVCGFETCKEDGLAEEDNGTPLYIYEAGQPRVQSRDNLVGYCKDKKPVALVDGFDRFASKLQAMRGMNADVILMDEIGVMESKSPRFCQAILDHLDGEVPILASVKYKDRPFLQQVRNHPKCRCFAVTPENRDELYQKVLAFVQEQLASRP